MEKNSSFYFTDNHNSQEEWCFLWVSCFSNDIKNPVLHERLWWSGHYQPLGLHLQLHPPPPAPLAPSLGHPCPLPQAHRQPHSDTLQESSTLAPMDQLMFITYQLHQDPKGQLQGEVKLPVFIWESGRVKILFMLHHSHPGITGTHKCVTLIKLHTRLHTHINFTIC